MHPYKDKMHLLLSGFGVIPSFYSYYLYKVNLIILLYNNSNNHNHCMYFTFHINNKITKYGQMNERTMHSI